MKLIEKGSYDKPITMNGLRLKVCGMRDSQNIRELLKLQPDYMGFIFFEKSPRNVGNDLDAQLLLSFPDTTQKVGVFVNKPLDSLRAIVRKYKLDYVQLHGDESVEYVGELYADGIKVIKVFSVGNEAFDFNQLKPYKSFVDFFLFDTKGKERGGNGITFDWKVLEAYDQSVPFLLSGGIDLENIEKLDELKGMNLHAIDVNSKFELEPGLKDVERVRELKSLI